MNQAEQRGAGLPLARSGNVNDAADSVTEAWAGTKYTQQVIYWLPQTNYFTLAPIDHDSMMVFGPSRSIVRAQSSGSSSCWPTRPSRCVFAAIYMHVCKAMQCKGQQGLDITLAATTSIQANAKWSSHTKRHQSEQKAQDDGICSAKGCVARRIDFRLTALLNSLLLLLLALTVLGLRRPHSTLAAMTVMDTPSNPLRSNRTMQHQRDQ